MENEKIRCAVVVYKLRVRDDCTVLDLLCGDKRFSNPYFVPVRSQHLIRYPHKKLSSSFVISIFHLGYSIHPSIQPLSFNTDDEEMKNYIKNYYNTKYGYGKVSIYFVDVDNKYIPF